MIEAAASLWKAMWKRLASIIRISGKLANCFSSSSGQKKVSTPIVNEISSVQKLLQFVASLIHEKNSRILSAFLDGLTTLIPDILLSSNFNIPLMEKPECIAIPLGRRRLV